MKNRYGDVYEYKRINENTFAVVGNLKYWRFGGKEGEQHVNLDDLGFADPSGGPFIHLGMSIEDRVVTRIRATGDLDGDAHIMLEVE